MQGHELTEDELRNLQRSSGVPEAADYRLPNSTGVGSGHNLPFGAISPTIGVEGPAGGTGAAESPTVLGCTQPS